MPDDFIDDDPNALETDMVQRSRKDLRGLERAAKEGRAAQAEAASLKRELALSRAGIPDTGPGKLFIKAYDGELTQEAIAAAAEEYGIFSSAPTPSTVPASELAAQSRMAQNAASDTTQSGPDIMAELNAATTQEQVMAIAAKHNFRGIDLRNYGS